MSLYSEQKAETVQPLTKALVQQQKESRTGLLSFSALSLVAALVFDEFLEHRDEVFTYVALTSLLHPVKGILVDGLELLLE